MEWSTVIHIVFGALIGGCGVMLFRLLRPTSATQMKVFLEARRLAVRYFIDGNKAYFVKEVRYWMRNIELVLVTADSNRQECRVTFARRHPDYAKIGKLEKMERVEFLVLRNPLDHLNPGEVCTYIRVASDERMVA